MDSLITAAARALAVGDPLGALSRVALRDDPPALALRGIAMAQLGEHARARDLLRRAARAFGAAEPVARARCVVAEAEVALAMRDLAHPAAALDAARAELEARGDVLNSAHARIVESRRLLLLGQLDAADRALTALARAPLPPPLAAVHALLSGGLAIRRLRSREAREALGHATAAAARSRIPALAGEVAAAVRMLDAPAARLIAHGTIRSLALAEVEALLDSPALVVDACRHAAQHRRVHVRLATRPVLFAVLRTLAEAWPGDAARPLLVSRAFGGRHADESHRARLRVEIGRLRRLVAGLAEVAATPQGFRLVPRSARDVVVLAPPVDTPHGAVLALLADGAAWSSSGLALALGTSQRSAQRALEALAATGQVEAFGRGRGRRWITPPLPGFATALLLPATLPID